MLYAEYHTRLGLPFDENGSAAPTTSLPRRPCSGCASGSGLDPRTDGVMYQDAPFGWSADHLRLPAPKVDQPTGRSTRETACLSSPPATACCVTT